MKGFALQHVEKAVLGVMMIVLIMMMIKGFGKEGLKPAQTTQKLQETIEQAQQHIVSVKTIPKDNGGENSSRSTSPASAKRIGPARPSRDVQEPQP